jgi:hypothetical protein
MSKSTFTRYEVKGLRSQFDGSMYAWQVRGIAKQPSPWRASVIAEFATEAEAKAHLRNIEEAA